METSFMQVRHAPRLREYANMSIEAVITVSILPVTMKVILRLLLTFSHPNFKASKALQRRFDGALYFERWSERDPKGRPSLDLVTARLDPTIPTQMCCASTESF